MVFNASTAVGLNLYSYANIPNKPQLASFYITVFLNHKMLTEEVAQNEKRCLRHIPQCHRFVSLKQAPAHVKPVILQKAVLK